MSVLTLVAIATASLLNSCIYASKVCGPNMVEPASYLCCCKVETVAKL